jgi:hypothetical protein
VVVALTILGALQGETYEDLFCKDSQQRGIIIIGDSATAHFQ